MFRSPTGSRPNHGRPRLLRGRSGAWLAWGMLATAVTAGCAERDRGIARVSAASQPPAPAEPSSTARPSAPLDEGPAEFRGNVEGEAVRLTLVTLRPGPISGVLSGLDYPLFLTGERSGSRIAGEMSQRGQRIPVEGTLAGDELLLRIGGAVADDEDGLLIVRLRRSSAAHEYPRSSPVPPAAADALVSVNGQQISSQEQVRFERDYRLRMVAGEYWYDRVSGAWGYVGGPTIGYLRPQLPLGGPLRPDASGSGTAVYVNGRALHPADLFQLQQIVGSVAPGRYSLDAQGTLGIEGGPPLVNLVAVVQAYFARFGAAAPGMPGGGTAGGGGDNIHRSGITGIGGNESGGSGYVMGEGWSVSY